MKKTKSPIPKSKGATPRRLEEVSLEALARVVGGGLGNPGEGPVT